MTTPNWQHKIINPAQLGGIETSVLDNGAGRGTRIAWINTGTGLRYKVILDRGMDISDAFFNQHSLAWLSHGGITSAQPFSDHHINWLRTFGGGLLTTCGLSHVGGPEKDEYGERGLHGQISNIPAEVESIIQPDPLTGNLHFSITGRMRETQVLGPNLELKRTMSGALGTPIIKIQDEVLNRGNTPAPHMLLYHCNFGWPLVDEGTEIIWQGTWESREGEPKNKIFREGNDFKTCLAPTDEHQGTGEEAAFIDISYDQDNQCTCGLYNQNLALAVVIRFDKNQLPWLTNWQHWGKNEYVMGMEPGTNPPTGQAKARAEGKLLFLMPGESRTYSLEIEILTNELAIHQFLNKNKT